MNMVLLAVLFGTVAVMADDTNSGVLYRYFDTPILTLADEYAFVLVNHGGENKPSASYVLAIRSSHTVLETTDVTLFSSVLKSIPRGSTLVEYDTCTVPLSWGLPASVRANLTNAIAEAGLVVSADVRHSCICGAMEEHKNGKAEHIPAGDRLKAPPGK